MRQCTLLYVTSYPVVVKSFRKPDDCLTFMVQCSPQMIAVCSIITVVRLMYKSGIQEGMPWVHKIWERAAHLFSGGVSLTSKYARILTSETVMWFIPNKDRRVHTFIINTNLLTIYRSDALRPSEGHPHGVWLIHINIKKMKLKFT